MGILTSENWAELLTPGLRRIFHLRLQNRESLYKRTDLFAVDTSTREYELALPIGEMDSQNWDFEDSGRVQYGEFEKGFVSRWTHREFAKGFTVRRKLVDDLLYPGADIPKTLSQQATKLADSAGIQRERSAAALFNGAFTDTGVDAVGFPFTGPDGVGLCSSAHAASPSNTTDTQENEGTDALTFDSVNATRIAMRKFTDDKAEIVAINPNELLVPPELEDTAFRINNSQLLPGTAENDVNINRNRWEVTIWDFLSDSGAWFMMDDMLRDESLIWYERVPLEYDAVGDFDTLQMKWRAYMRYSRYWSDWRWIYGQKPRG